MVASLVVHYGEIGTKGNNRNLFERCLARNLVTNLHPIPLLHLAKLDQRFFLEVDARNVQNAMRSIGETFGVSWFAPVETVELEYSEIEEKVVEMVEKDEAGGESFRITAKRPNKKFPVGSTELARRLGAAVVERVHRRVDLSDPDICINVDILSNRAVIYSRKFRGLGGLPVGVSGKVVHLLSGGIDSPAAAWSMMKRGCRVIYLHFFVGREPGEVLDSKILGIVKRLSRYGGRSMLISLPFSVYQIGTASLPQNYEPIVFRAFIRRVAETMAYRFDALAISTGDNLGQVASQTLYNLASIDRDAALPILRPLLAFDKTEIVDLAKSIGTYELSIAEYRDCCALLSSHPKTRADPETVHLFLSRLNTDKMIAEMISGGSLTMHEPADNSVSSFALDPYFRSPVARAPEQG